MARSCKIYFYALTSGFLLAFSVLFEKTSFLGWFGFIPFFIGIHNLKKNNEGLQKFIIYSLIWGLSYFLLTFRWFWGLYPLDSVGLGPVSSVAIIAAIWFLTALFLSLFWLLFGLLLRRIKNPDRFSLFFSFFAAGAFVLIEFLRSYGIGLLWYGSGSIIGPHWTLGNIAYALHASRLILFLSSYVGIYGVLFLIVFINYTITQYLFSEKDGLRFKYLLVRKFLLLVTIFSLFSSKISFLKSPQESGTTVPFTVIQTKQTTSANGGAEELFENFRTLSESFQTAVKQHPESKLIVFSEGSNFFKNLSTFLSPKQVQTFFSRLSKDPKIIIDNSRITDKIGIYSRVLTLNTHNDIVGYYDKKLLTPGGEFFPHIAKAIGYGFLFKDRIKAFESGSSLTAGKNEKITNFEGIHVVTAVCSDLLSPSLIRKKSAEGKVLVGMSSTAIFHGNNALVQQILAINKFRAAENRIPIILAANYGLSYVIDSSGNIRKIALDNDPKIFTGLLVPSVSKSWYTKVGDWPILVLCLGIIFLYLGLHRRCKKSE